MEYILKLVATHREPWLLHGAQLADAHLTMAEGLMTMEDLSNFIGTSACIDGFGDHPITLGTDVLAQLFKWSEVQARFNGGEAKHVPSSKCGAIVAFMAFASAADEVVLSILDRLNGLSEWKRLEAKRERREKRAQIIAGEDMGADTGAETERVE
jgi:hypothetical protein